MAFIQVSGVPFLAENSKPEERVHMFSMHFALMTVANVIGSLFGGVIADLLRVVLGAWCRGINPLGIINWRCNLHNWTSSII